MSHYLDLEAWSRRQLFDWFRTYEHPFFNICAPVDVTRLARECKERGVSFSLAYHYLSVRAANEVEAFRYRLRGDRVLVHERVHCGTTVPVGDESFAFCYVEHVGDFESFETSFTEEMARIEARDGRLEPREDRDDLIHYSVLPWVSFTSISHARRDNDQDSIPKIVFGKTYESAGRLMMPHAVDAHHALMDGLHAGWYFERFQQLLDGAL